MRLLLAIALLAAAPDTTPRVRGRELGEGTRVRDQLDQRPVAPLFSFAVPAPGYKGYAASYAGLPATDGCYPAASVTGTKGEALTFTRATTRFCPTSANEATGVMCASGEVCITSSGSTRGISIFRAGTNIALRSQEFVDAAWALANSGASAISREANSADCGAAPDGTQTAEKITIPDVASEQYSLMYQVIATTATGHSRSLWMKKLSGASIVNTHVWNATTGYTSQTAHTVTTSWARYSKANVTLAASDTYHYIGTDARAATAAESASSAIVVCVWGFQSEASPYVTPYVATTSASATRHAETATFPISWSGSAWSAASTLVQRKATAGFGIIALHSSFPAGGPNALSYVTGGGLMSMYSAGAEHATFDPSAYYSTTDRAATYCTGAASGNIWAGHETTGTTCGSFSTGNTTLALGWFTTNTQLDGLISSVCIDPSSTRCR